MPRRAAAHLGHAALPALPALPALEIAVGWAETNFGGHAVQWFGVEMPRVFPETGEGLLDLAEDLHKWHRYAVESGSVQLRYFRHGDSKTSLG